MMKRHYWQRLWPCLSALGTKARRIPIPVRQSTCRHQHPAHLAIRQVKYCVIHCFLYFWINIPLFSPFRTDAFGGVPDFATMTEDEQIAYAMRMSMQPGEEEDEMDAEPSSKICSIHLGWQETDNGLFVRHTTARYIDVSDKKRKIFSSLIRI